MVITFQNDFSQKIFEQDNKTKWGISHEDLRHFIR